MNYLKEPSISELMEKYREISVLERAKTGSPCPRRVDNVITGVRRVCMLSEIALDSTLSAISSRQFDNYFVSASKLQMSSVTVRSYLDCMRALTARWCRVRYLEFGWDVKPFEAPASRKPDLRYNRPSEETLRCIREWYGSLRSRSDIRLWVAATLMLEFGMRNGDAIRLTWDAFERRGGKVYLRYRPRKTTLSSGRFVRWPVHPELWRTLSAMHIDDSQRVLSNGREVYRRLNMELRTLGFTGSKASYELRKICIDHVYQRFGAEMAVSISGDDIRTVIRYYADPSAVVQDSVRIYDLLGAGG